MKRHAAAIGLFVLGSLAPADDFRPHEAIVRIAPGSTVQEFLALLNLPGVTVLRAVETRQIYLLGLPADQSETEFDIELDMFENPNPAVPDPLRPLIWGELNYEREASEGQTGSIYFSRVPGGRATYQQQYALARIGAPAAQLLSTGEGTLVAIVDTGIAAEHEALAGRLADGGWNCVADSPMTDDVGDGVDNDADGTTDEMVGHGTFVAGLVALIAPEARILPVVALDSDGVGDGFIVAQAIYHAIDAGADVINLSLGSAHDSRVIRDAVADARQSGAVVVAAAGNLNRSDPAEYPAMEGNLLGVAAVDDADLKTASSNFSHELALSAPGASADLPGAPGLADPARSIFSAVPGGGLTDYAAWDGTSMATAFVSGAAALARARVAGWPACQQTTEDIEHALRSAAVDIDALNPDYAGQLGDGRLDIAAALDRLTPSPLPGDVNRDGRVGLSDLSELLADFGTQARCCDIDADGWVGISDLVLLLSSFGY